MFSSIKHAFSEGGWPMWPIGALLVICWAIAIERIIYLWTSRVDKRYILSQLKSKIMSGNIQGAITLLSATPSPLARILRAGLVKFNRPLEEVQAAMDETALTELPKIEARTGYLAMLANVATLVGLLGTILGMIKSFAGASDTSISADVSKAKIIGGIAEAMNCTAFGLICAVPALLFFAALNGWTQQILDTINEVSVQVMNMVVSHRKAVTHSVQETE